MNAKAFGHEVNAKAETTALFDKFTAHIAETFPLGKAALQPTRDAKGKQRRKGYSWP